MSIWELAYFIQRVSEDHTTICINPELFHEVFFQFVGNFFGHFNFSTEFGLSQKIPDATTKEVSL